MGSHRAKGLFQRIVGPWEINEISALKESRSITGGHFQKMGDGIRERAGGLGGFLPVHQYHLIALAQRGSIEAIFIGKDMSRLLHKPRRMTQRRPQRRGLPQCLGEESLQALERDAEPLFCSTRSSESAMDVSRACKRKPGASSGARPSSVMAARTARQ